MLLFLNFWTYQNTMKTKWWPIIELRLNRNSENAALGFGLLLPILVPNRFWPNRFFGVLSIFWCHLVLPWVLQRENLSIQRDKHFLGLANRGAIRSSPAWKQTHLRSTDWAVNDFFYFSISFKSGHANWNICILQQQCLVIVVSLRSFVPRYPILGKQELSSKNGNYPRVFNVSLRFCQYLKCVSLNPESTSRLLFPSDGVDLKYFRFIPPYLSLYPFFLTMWIYICTLYRPYKINKDVFFFRNGIEWIVLSILLNFEYSKTFELKFTLKWDFPCYFEENLQDVKKIN